MMTLIFDCVERRSVKSLYGVLISFTRKPKVFVDLGLQIYYKGLDTDRKVKN